MAKRYPNLPAHIKEAIQSTRVNYTNETDVKNEVRAMMKKIKAFNLGAGGHVGASDQKWLYRGIIILIEVKWDLFKRGGLKATQQVYLLEGKEHGAVSMVIDRNNLYYLRRFLQYLPYHLSEAFGVYKTYLDINLFSRPLVEVIENAND